MIRFYQMLKHIFKKSKRSNNVIKNFIATINNASGMLTYAQHDTREAGQKWVDSNLPIYRGAQYGYANGGAVYEVTDKCEVPVPSLDWKKIKECSETK